MCAAVLDNWFGIDRPTTPAPTTPITPPAIIANPSAAEKGLDLSTPSGDNTLGAKAKRRGTASLRIDRAGTTASSGLNIPQA